MSEQLAKRAVGRNPILDYLKGIAAIFVVLGHCISYLEHYSVTVPLWLRVIGTLVSSVHVPLFFLISGYLCHRQPYGSYLKKKLEKILLPYVVFALLKLVFNLFISSDNAHGGSLWYNLYDSFILGGAYWFVYCILLIFLIAPLWWRREGESLKRYNARLLLTIGALIAFNVVTVDFGLSPFPQTVTTGGVTLETPLFQVERVLFYLPYFLAGMLLKANDGAFTAFYGKWKPLLLSAAPMLAAGACWLVVSGTVDKGFGPKLLIAVSMMLLLYALCRRISGKAAVLGVCGRYSLQIMFFDSFFHAALFMVIAKITSVQPVYALPVAALDVAGSVLLCMLLEKIPIVRKLFGL